MLGVPGRRVDEMLDLVSLTPAEADRRVGNYSLGMRQRLGIATALIGNPGVLDPRRAGQRPRPRRHPVDARPAPRLRGPGRDGAAVLAPAARGRDHRRRHRDDRPRPDRVRRAPRRTSSGRWAPSPGPTTSAALRRALHAAGIDTTVSDDGGVTTAAEPAHVGHVAFTAGIALTELRTADGGLEDMFLELTADTQREDTHPRSSAEKGKRHDHHHLTHDVRTPRTSSTATVRRSPWDASSASSCARCSTPVPGSG